MIHTVELQGRKVIRNRLDRRNKWNPRPEKDYPLTQNTGSCNRKCEHTNYWICSGRMGFKQTQTLGLMGSEVWAPAWTQKYSSDKMQATTLVDRIKCRNLYFKQYLVYLGGMLAGSGSDSHSGAKVFDAEVVGAMKALEAAIAVEESSPIFIPMDNQAATRSLERGRANFS